MIKPTDKAASIYSVNTTSIDPTPIMNAYAWWYHNMVTAGCRPSTRHEVIYRLIMQDVKVLHFMSSPEGSFSIIETDQPDQSEVDAIIEWLAMRRKKRRDAAETAKIHIEDAPLEAPVTDGRA